MIKNGSGGSSTSIPLLPPPPKPSKTTVAPVSKHESNARPSVGLSLGQVQNTKNARVYVFGESDVTEEDLNHHNNFELRSRGVKNTHRHGQKREPQEVIFLEREIKDGDTLEKFALQYGCTIIELKQANKLTNNQEFFALRTIKIPVKRYGLLTESEEERKRRGFSESEVTSPTESYHSINGESDDSDVLYRTLSIGAAFDDCKEGDEFLKIMDKDLKKIARSTKTNKESLEEVASVLNGRSIRPLQFPKDRRTDSYWSSHKSVVLIACVILVSLVVAVVILYKRNVLGGLL